MQRCFHLTLPQQIFVDTVQCDGVLGDLVAHGPGEASVDAATTWLLRAPEDRAEEEGS